MEEDNRHVALLFITEGNWVGQLIAGFPDEDRFEIYVNDYYKNNPEVELGYMGALLNPAPGEMCSKQRRI